MTFLADLWRTAWAAREAVRGDPCAPGPGWRRDSRAPALGAERRPGGASPSERGEGGLRVRETGPGGAGHPLSWLRGHNRPPTSCRRWCPGRGLRLLRLRVIPGRPKGHPGSPVCALGGRGIRVEQHPGQGGRGTQVEQDPGQEWASTRVRRGHLG